MIKVVCLDLFSTLVDVGDVPLSVGRMTADVLGMSRERWNALCFSSAHEICKPTSAYDVVRTLVHSHDASVCDSLIQQAVTERQQRFNYALTQHIQGDVLDGLSALKSKGYTLVLVSNASTAEVHAWSQSPLAELFDYSVFSCEVGLKKPDHAIYKYAIGLVSASADECLFVGDGGSDELIGAYESEMKVLLMTRFLKKNKQQRLNDFAKYIDGSVASTMDIVEWLAQQ